MNCTKIKRIIDEADRPDVFPLEAAGHMAGCLDCQSFADERAKLRELTGSVARVTAPGNFNALLNERLSRVKSQRSSWLTAAGLMRVGAATAGLLVVFVVLQYSGLLSPTPPTGDGRKAMLARESPGEESAAPRGFVLEGVTPGKQLPMVAGIPTGASDHRGTGSRQASRTNHVAASRPPKDSGQDGPPQLIVRDSNGDFSVPIITVSLGMQQQLRNGSYGRQQPRSDISY